MPQKSCLARKKAQKRLIVCAVSQPSVPLSPTEAVSSLKNSARTVSTSVVSIIDETNDDPVYVEPTSEQVKESKLLKDCVMKDVLLTNLASNALSANCKATVDITGSH